MIDNELTELAKVGGDFPVAPAQGIAAVALTMAMKYYDINTVQDGTLYQQYKMEGKNLEPLSIHSVFEVAKQIEAHLMAANDRIASIVIDALTIEVDDDEDMGEEQDENETRKSESHE